MVIAETFVAMPFLVISVEGALRAADARFEDAAATLGADRWTTFRRVTLPLVAPGIAAGAVLCWARALGEFGATITFAGNFPGTTQTMPLAVYLALQRDPEAAIVLSLVLLVVSLGTLLLLRDRWLGRTGAGRMSLSARVVVQRGSLGRRRRARRWPTARCSPSSGPNGAGKSTAPAGAGRAAARRTAARVVVDGARSGTTATGTCPPHRRALGMVFQDHLLFPHLVGRRQRRVRAAHAGACGGRRPARRPAPWLARVGLDGLGDRRPAELSGGQAQRAALARALVGDPRVLLLDEPLSALDARTRLTVRAELRRHLADFAGSTVLVTHDPVDAMALADRVVVVEDGRVVQAGTPAEVSPPPAHRLRRPAGRAVAAARHRGRAQVRLDGGGEVAVAEEAAGPVFAAVRPESVALYLSRPDGQPAQRLAGAAGRRHPARRDGALRAGRRGAADRRRHRDRVRRARAGARRGGLGDGQGLRGRRLRPLTGR